MAKAIYTICFENPVNHKRSFMDTDLSLKDWKAAYPDMTVVHAYRINGDFKSVESNRIYEFNNNCIDFGLSKEWLNKQFTTKDGTYELIGLKTANTKYKCILRDVATGKTIKCTPNYVINGFAGKL